MKIQYRVGDAFAAHESILIHGVNALGAFNSGFAGAMRKRHPLAYEKYDEVFRLHGLKLGQVVWAISENKRIGHLVSQAKFGRDPNVIYADYDGIRNGMIEVNRYATEVEEEYAAMPLIGAGLGNASWAKIAQIIEEESKNFYPIVYTLDGNIPD